MKRLIATLALVATACSGPATPSPAPSSPATGSATPTASASPAGPSELVVMTHDAFAVSDDVLAQFEQQHSVTVRVLRAGDAGQLVNQAILARDAPLADVLYGVDNTFLSRALDAGIFEAYQSAELSKVPAEFLVDPQHRVTPIDYGDVCLNYDTSAFGAQNPPPATIDALTDSRYRDQLVVENPATSSPGLAFVLATTVRFGDSGSFTWQDYWGQLRANGVLVSDNWEDAYYNQFSGAASTGNRPIVVSYATSPAAEIVGAASPPANPPTANIDDGCFRQVEFAAVLAGGRPAAKSLAHAWIDFMLSRTFQDDIPLQMYVYPVDPAATIPDVFNQTQASASQPIELPYDQIGQVRDQVIQEWTNVVLH
jgi:thiamine transport system substrate-binding protein